MQHDKQKYRPDIDGLRAIAIISVIFYHAGFPGFPGGFVGVDVFFVISGFLITSLLFNEAAASGRVNLSAFYARRVRRLMPASFVVVAATLLIGAFLLAPASDEQRNLAHSAKAFAYFGSNFFFFRTTGGYFDAPSFSLPLLHTWSLAVEEQYYLIWPLIMLLVFRMAGEQRTEAFMRRRSIAVLGVMFVASLALCIGTTRDHQNFAFYLLPARVWEFAIGGIVGLAGAAFYARLRWCAEGLAVAGLALIVYSIVAFDHSTSFPGWAAMIPVFGSVALIVGMTANENGFVRRMVGCKPMVFIGLLSYSWYLWHWPLLSMYRMYNLGAQDLAGNAVIVPVALVLAWFTYIWIEHPIRTRRPGPFRNVRPTLFVGLGIAVSTVLMSYGLRWWRDYQKELDLYRPFVSARDDYSPYRAKCTLDPHKPFGDLPFEACVQGPNKTHPKVLLWGDSHADHVMPMLVEAFPDVPVYQLTMAGCPPIIGYESQVPAVSKYCSAFNQRVLEEIPNLKKRGLEAVVISGRWPSYLWQRALAVSQAQPNGAGDPEKLTSARANMQKMFDETLSKFEQAGLRVLVLTPNPELVYPPLQCIGMGRGSYCDVPRSISETLVGDPSAALAEIVSRHPNVRLGRLMDFFCDEQTCYVVRDGKILYLDEDHISATAARGLAGFLDADLKWLIGKPDSRI